MNLRKAIRISRPIGWLFAPLIYIAYMKLIGIDYTLQIIIQILVLTFPLCFFIYGINDIYDYKSDEINSRKGNIEGAIVSKNDFRRIKKLSYLMLVLLLFSSFITFNLNNILAMSLFIFLSYSYSVPPLRLKEKPILDSITNAFIVFSVILLAASFSQRTIPIIIYYILFAITGIHAFTTALDYEADKKANMKTFAVIIGKRTAIYYAILTQFITIFFSGIKNIYVLYFLSMNAILFSISSINPTKKMLRIIFNICSITFIIFSLLYILK